MAEPKNPSEVARETLMRLAAARLQPTPANYQACYNEIAQLPQTAPFAEAPLRQIAALLPGRNKAQLEQLANLEAAIARHSWLGVQEALLFFLAGHGSEPEGQEPGSRGSEPLVLSVLPPEFAAKLARFIESVLPALGDENERVKEMAGDLLLSLRQPVTNLALIQEMLGNFSRQVLFVAEEQVEIKASLLKLLHLIIENVGELSFDDSWLKGQIDGLLAAVAPPLTLRHLDEMERRLRDVMAKQGEAKSRSVLAQEEMRQMLSAFIERLGVMSESSTVFQGKIEASAKEIERVKNIEDLAPLLKGVISATSLMVENMSEARLSLNSLQARVLATEAELVQLHLDLDSASALARHDPLTDMLNRKGMDEALVREVSNARRKGSLLSICLLDIDNFKKLNDRLGHEAGDNALIHLADVARNCMRPSDTLARYGGEEFVVLMPDTSQEQGVEAMIRLQRELTKAFFLSGKENVLITFSAGVAQLTPEETGADAIKRADQAMYLAKRAGKNRVMSA